MCHRISPFLIKELQAALDERQSSGHARLPRRDSNVTVPDAYPGTQVPLFVLDEQGELQARELMWGFEGFGSLSQRLIFNTRIETALQHLRTGTGMWTHPINAGRCLVPVRCFYESWTINPPRRSTQVRFEMKPYPAFLLAGVYDRDRFSVMTTEPNEDVRGMHSRMPLVLGPGESSIWLSSDFASLVNRSHIRLTATPEVSRRDAQQVLFE